jgi:hypothetical protein
MMSILVTFIVPSTCYLLGEAIANALWGEAFPCHARAVNMKALGIIKNNLSETLLLAKQPFLGRSPP